MGQQQLLLLILTTVIVGIATAIAVTTFANSSAATNVDSVRQDLGNLATIAVTYHKRPELLGGGGGSFENIRFDDLKFGIDTLNATGNVARNDNGRYVITSASADELVIIGNPRTDVRGLQDVSNTSITDNALQIVITPDDASITQVNNN